MAKMTIKQQRFADEYIISGNARLNAASELIKRYTKFDELIDSELIEECKEVIGSKTARSHQKRAAKILLNTKFGRQKANLIVEDFAIVTDRNDSLVNRWRNKVKERDVNCQLCSSNKNLEVHHVSHWADDPVNRINIENGIVLCNDCHSKQHPELSKGLFGGDKHER